MPSGRTHDQITLMCLPWVGGLSLLVTFNPALALCLCCGFLFSGLMFGPDLDIYSKQYQRWGPLRFIWIPYQKTLSHRSWLSHGPVMGTALRLIYLAVWASLFLGLGELMAYSLGRGFGAMTQTLAILERAWRQHPQSCLTLLLGLELGAMSHSFSDGVSSGYRILFRRSKKMKHRSRSRSRR